MDISDMTSLGNLTALLSEIIDERRPIHCLHRRCHMRSAVKTSAKLQTGQAHR